MTEDKIVDNVILSYKLRSKLGQKKYNTTLEADTHTDLLGWLNHLQEELMDATLYIEKLKQQEYVNSKQD